MAFLKRDAAKNIDENLLIAHNIACAVSIIATIKGIDPKAIDPDDVDAQGVYTNLDMDKIISSVSESYQYALWKTWHHNRDVINEIIKHSDWQTWRSASPNQG